MFQKHFKIYSKIYYPWTPLPGAWQHKYSTKTVYTIVCPKILSYIAEQVWVYQVRKLYGTSICIHYIFIYLPKISDSYIYWKNRTLSHHSCKSAADCSKAVIPSTFTGSFSLFLLLLAFCFFVFPFVCGVNYALKMFTYLCPWVMPCYVALHLSNIIWRILGCVYDVVGCKFWATKVLFPDLLQYLWFIGFV